MVSVTTLPFSRPLTRADLEVMPDDGHRYELIDGALIVTPAPATRHQSVVLELAVLLREHCPGNLKVLIAPFDLALADDTVLQPDVLVARRSDLTDRDLPAPPQLAVEVLSASTRRIDLLLKRSRLEAAGCRAYWIVDPDAPSLIAWELRDGAYAQVALVTGDETYWAQQPYRLEVSPARLVVD
jgi:Uma2 family endonuclease